MKKIITILAGGTGKRMGNVKLPKQFLEICGVPVMFKYDRKNVPSEKLIERAGNLLSFGAYITLLSKYARYSLPLGDVQTLIQKEMVHYIGQLQQQLFSYKQKGTDETWTKSNVLKS